MEALKSFKDQLLFQKMWAIQPDTLSPYSQKEKPANRYSIRNIIMNVKLKTKVSKMLSNLSSRRYNKLTPPLINKIKDSSYFYSHNSKIKEIFNNDLLDEPIDTDNQNQVVLRKKISLAGINKSTKKLLEEKMKQMLENIPIIDPNSLYKLVWDSIQSVIIVVMITVAPVKLAIQDYSLSYYLGSWYSLFVIVILIILDILIHLNTAFFRNGRIETNRKEIIKNYLYQVGVCDILITQSLIYELSQTKDFNTNGALSLNLKHNWFYLFQNILLLLLLYYKTTKLHKYLFKIEETFSFKRRTLNILSLVKLLFFIIKVAHTFSCLWLYIGRTNAPKSWLHDIDQGWLVEYLKAYYFITVTMTTIGYGDIVPTNNIETIISIFSMIIACGVFGYVINSIGSIFLELKKEGEEKKENLFIINRYMSEKNISRDLQSSIREYLEYYWNQWKDDNSEKEQKILDQLSEEMRTSLLLQANRMILEDCQFFQRNFTQDAIQKSVNIIKEKKLTPNEYLINSTEDISKSGILFFVQRGEIDIYQEFSLDSSSGENFSNLIGNQQPQYPNQQIGNQYSILAQNETPKIFKSQNDDNEKDLKEKKKYTKHVQTIKQGQYLGEMSFFTNFPNKFVAKSRNFSKVLYIERDKFLDFLKQNHFQDDFETFCFIMDSINQNELQFLFQKCTFCRSYEHTPFQCPIVHYQPLRMLLIYKHNFSQDISERKYVSRRRVKIKNCLLYLESTCSSVEKYQEKNESYIEENIKLVDYSQTEISSDYQEEYGYDTGDEENQCVEEELINLKNIQNTSLLNPISIDQKNNDESDDQMTSNEGDHDDNTVFHSPIYDLTTSNDLKRVKWSHSLSLMQKFTSSFEKIEKKKSQRKLYKKKHQTSILKKKVDNIPISFFKNQSENTINIQQKCSFPLADINQISEVLEYPHSKDKKQIKDSKEDLLRQSSKKKLTICNKKKTISSQMIEKPQEHHQTQGYAPPHLSLLKRYNSQQLDGSQNIQSSVKIRKKEQIRQKQKTQVKEDKIIDHQNLQRYSILQFFNWDVKFDSLFENMKIFKNYFPNQNHDKIIQRLKKKRLQENTILKLNFSNKLSLQKNKSLNKESLFQTIKNKVNILKLQAKLNSSRFSHRSSILSVNTPRQCLQLDSLIQNDKSHDFVKQDLDQQIKPDDSKANDVKSDQKNTSMFLQKIKFGFTKSAFSPQNSLIHSFKEKQRVSLQNESELNLNEDYNLEDHKESLTHMIRINYKKNKNKSNQSQEDLGDNKDTFSD